MHEKKKIKLVVEINCNTDTIVIRELHRFLMLCQASKSNVKIILSKLDSKNPNNHRKSIESCDLY